jgi:hypothetical protein
MKMREKKSQVFDAGMAPTPVWRDILSAFLSPKKLSKLIRLFSRTNKGGLAHTKNE